MQHYATHRCGRSLPVAAVAVSVFQGRRARSSRKCCLGASSKWPGPLGTQVKRSVQRGEPSGARDAAKQRQRQALRMGLQAWVPDLKSLALPYSPLSPLSPLLDPESRLRELILCKRTTAHQGIVCLGSPAASARTSACGLPETTICFRTPQKIDIPIVPI